MITVVIIRSNINRLPKKELLIKLCNAINLNIIYYENLLSGHNRNNFLIEFRFTHFYYYYFHY